MTMMDYSRDNVNEKPGPSQPSQLTTVDSNVFSGEVGLPKAQHDATEQRQRYRKSPRKSRPRRNRKGRLHNQNGNSWRYNIGAPRNDNEFLLNQKAESDPETAFPYATSDDETDKCPICKRMELRKDSGMDSEDETTSGYASCSPFEINRHVCLPKEMSSLNIHSSSEDGPDPYFVERNFEADYEENLMSVLQDSSKEQLVFKCRQLMQRVKELESQSGKGTTSSSDAGIL